MLNEVHSGKISLAKMFLAGLMNWIGKAVPKESDLAGKRTLRLHIKTIHETGLDGSILGYRNLCLDNIEPNFF